MSKINGITLYKVLKSNIKQIADFNASYNLAKLDQFLQFKQLRSQPFS